MKRKQDTAGANELNTGNQQGAGKLGHGTEPKTQDTHVTTCGPKNVCAC